MSEWQPANTQPLDGSLVELRFANGQTCFAQSGPAIPMNHHERKEMAKIGVWPNYRDWKIVEWRPATEDDIVVRVNQQIISGDTKP